MKARTVLIVPLLCLMACAVSPDNDRLIADLDNDNPDVRRRALSSLLLRGHDTETVGKLSALLDSDNERLVFIASQILTTPADSLAIPALGKLLSHPNDVVRNNAVQSLGLIGHKNAVPYLAEALADSSTDVCRNALRMLALLEDPSAANVIRKAMHHDSKSVRVEAVNALYTLFDEKTAAVTAADFIPLLADDDEIVRFVAAQALGEDYPDRDDAEKALITSLDDKSGNVRFEAIGSLAKLDCRESIPKLKEIHDYVSYAEQIAISNAIKDMTGEDFPAFRANMADTKK